MSFKGLAWIAAFTLVGGLVFAFTLRYFQRPPQGPVEPAWNRQVCAHCGMILDNRFFAGQIQAHGGEIYFFDDPGCLIAFQDQKKPDARAIYLHHHLREAWLAWPKLGFVPAVSPMGFGLGCVGEGEAGAKALEWARARVKAGLLKQGVKQ